MQNELTFKHVTIWREFNGDSKGFHERDGHITMCSIMNSNVRPLYSFIAEDNFADVNQYNDMYKVKTTNGKREMEFKLKISQTYFPGFIKDLRHYYKHGRVLVGKRLYEPVSHSWAGCLCYQEVKKLSRFENRACRYPEKASRAVRTIDPTRITEYLDLKDYAIEQWGGGTRKRYYSFITFKKETYDWVCSFIGN